MVAQILEYLDGKELFVRIVESEEDITEAHIADFIQQILTGKRAAHLFNRIDAH